MPVFKNGDAGNRPGNPKGSWWKSEESDLARIVIMSEVLLGKHIFSVLHYCKTHFVTVEVA